MKALVQRVGPVLGVIILCLACFLVGGEIGAKVASGKIPLAMHSLDVALQGMQVDLERGDIAIASQKLEILRADRFDLATPSKIEALKRKLESLEKQR